MIRRSLSVLAFAAAASIVSGCSSGASGDEPSEDSEGALARAGSSHAYRLDSPDFGTWMFRLETKAGKVDGHFAWVVPKNVPALELGKVTGTVDANGQYKMTWTVPGVGLGPSPPLDFEGTLQNGSIQGAWSVPGEAPKPAVLQEIKPGTLDQGQTIAVTYAGRDKTATCVADSLGFEVFGLANTALEKTINDKVSVAMKKAATGCKGPITWSNGGAWLGVVRPDLISFTSSEMVDADDDSHYRYEFGERLTVSLDTGTPLELFGDVIQPGQEAALTTAIEHAIDAMQPRDIEQADKDKMKSVMLSPAGLARLPKLFSLGERSLIFAAEGCDTPRIHGVGVPYTALTAILVPNGKAKSAWNP